MKVVKGVGGGSSSRELLGQTGGLLLSDSLFSKELENMGKHLAGRHLSGCVRCVWRGGGFFV